MALTPPPPPPPPPGRGKLPDAPVVVAPPVLVGGQPVRHRVSPAPLRPRGAGEPSVGEEHAEERLCSPARGIHAGQFPPHPLRRTEQGTDLRAGDVSAQVGGAVPRRLSQQS